MLDERADFFRRPVHAVLVGTGHHPSGGELPDVESVLPTLRAFAECLTDQCGVRETNIAIFEDPKDAGELVKKVRAVAEAAADGIFLFYYIGHGLVDPVGGALHLALATADSSMPLEGRKLPFDTVREIVTSPSRRKQQAVVILDCCNSGRATRFGMPVAPLEFENGHVQGAFVLAASGDDEAAWAPPDQPYTAFSGALINLLCHGDPDLPPVLALDDVYEFLYRKRPPTPRRYNNDRVGRLVVAGNPGYRGPTIRSLKLPEGPPQPGCPYPGLKAFDAADHAMFYGREDETTALVKKIRSAVGAHRPQIVTGPSGVGKSSLLKAGLLRAVTEGRLAMPGSSGWPQRVIVPGQDPLAALSAVRLSADGRMILVVDQFEEIFATGIDEETRQAFIEAVHAAAEGGAVVVLGLRSDFFTACVSYPLLKTALDSDFILGPVELGALRDIVELPAGRAGLAVEKGLVETLLGDADAGVASGRKGPAGAGVLPLLSHALYVTWTKRQEVELEDRSVTALTVNGYLDSGRIAGALESTAQGVYDGLPADHGQDLGPVARRVFVDLVQLTDTGTTTIQTRRPVRRADLARPGDPDGAVDRVISAFADERILTLDQDMVQIAHESLLTAWKTLEDWLGDDQDWVRLQREVHADAARWRQAESSEWLYPPSRLDAVKTALESQHHTRTEMDRLSSRFLDASDRERRRKLIFRRGAQSILVLLLVASLVATVVAQEQRDQALARQIAIEAEQLRTVDPALSRQLSAAAYRISPTVEARSELLSTQSLPVDTRLDDHTGQIFNIAQSVDRRILATAGDDGQVRLWDVADPHRPHKLAAFRVSSAARAVFAVAFSPKNHVLATGDDDGAVRLWDVTDPRRPVMSRTTLQDGGGRIESLTFSPDATTLAGADGTGMIRRWDLPGGTALPPLPMRAGVSGVTFSPAGDILAAGGQDGAVRLWDVTARRAPRPIARGIPASPKALAAIAFSPDGHLLAVAGYDNTVRLWTVSRSGGATPYGSTMRHSNSVYALAFSPDGTRLAAAGSDSAVLVSDVATQRTIASLPLTDPVQALSFLGKAGELVSAGNDGLLRFWHLDNRLIHTRQGNQILVALTPDGRLLATAGNDPSIKLWNLSDPAVPLPLGDIPVGAEAGVQRLSFSGDGRLLAAPELNGTINLWDMADPRHPVPRKTVLRATAEIFTVAFSPDRRYLVSGQEDGTVLVWDLRDPNRSTPIATLADRKGAILGLAYSRDGRLLAASGGDSTTRVYDMTRPAAPRQRGPGFGGQTRYVNSVRFAPDSLAMATGAGDGTILVRQARNPKAEVLRMQNAGTSVLDLAYPRDDLLAEANADGSMWIYTVDRGKASVYAKLRSSDRPVFAVAADFTGRRLVTANGDGTVVSWNPDPEQVITEMCGSVGKTITDREWSSYVQGHDTVVACDP